MLSTFLCVHLLSTRWQRRSVSLCVRPARWPWCPVELGRWVPPNCQERCWTSWPASPMWWRSWPASPSPRWNIHHVHVCSFCFSDFCFDNCQSSPGTKGGKIKDLPHHTFLFCRWLCQSEETGYLRWPGRLSLTAFPLVPGLPAWVCSH